jgi:lipopolysaccharide heptosyltransferase II
MSAYRNYSSRARRLARALDAAAVALAPAIRRVAPRRESAGAPRAVLVVRLDHLGDVLMTTPAIASLRRAFPAARIDVLAAPWGRGALEGNPDVSGVREGIAPWYDPRNPSMPPLRRVLRVSRDLRRDAYDWAFDFRGDPRVVLFYLLPAAPRRFGFSRLGLESLLTDSVPYDRARSLLDQGLDLVAAAGVEPAERMPVFRFGESAAARAAGLLAEAGVASSPFAVVAPAANRPPACWGGERFASVADGLRDAGIPVLLVGRREDGEILGSLSSAARHSHADLSGRTGLADLAAILARASLLVSNDSGPAHLAAAVDCPTVAVFGPTDARLTFPYEDGVRFVSVRGPVDHPLPCFDGACGSDHGFSSVEPRVVLEAGLRALAAGRPAVRRA